MRKMLSFLLFCIFMNFPFYSYAFLIDTHYKITNETISKKHDKLSLAIKEQTGVNNPLENYATFFSANKMLKEWFSYGSQQEDEPIWSLRYLNHFYNSLAGSGLADGAFGRSSLDWANNSGNEWTWKTARDNYYFGLTKPADAERKTGLANSFRALGQVMHLVQDLSSPAHVRNDAHPEGDGFEAYTSKNLNALNYSLAEFKGSMVSINPSAPKQLWDSEQYDGTNPSVDNSVGLAEYTNANFASQDTIFTENYLGDWSPLNDKHYFPYPRMQDTEIYEEKLDQIWMGQDVYRKYFRKVAGGEKVEHFAAASRLYLHMEDPDPSIQGFDDQCHKDYADLLIPRAVAYSAALLDYFFRGQIDMVADTGNSGQYLIKNESDEELSGTFALYYDDKTGYRKPVSGAEWPLSIAAKGSSGPVAITAPNDAKEAGKYMLVFQGRMGQEDGAVVGRNVVLEKGPGLYLEIYVNGSPIYWDLTSDSEVVPLQKYDITDYPFKIGSYCAGKTVCSGMAKYTRLSGNNYFSEFQNHVALDESNTSMYGTNLDLYLEGINKPIFRISLDYNGKGEGTTSWFWEPRDYFEIQTGCGDWYENARSGSIVRTMESLYPKVFGFNRGGQWIYVGLFEKANNYSKLSFPLYFTGGTYLPDLESADKNQKYKIMTILNGAIVAEYSSLFECYSNTSSTVSIIGPVSYNTVDLIAQDKLTYESYKYTEKYEMSGKNSYIVDYYQQKPSVLSTNKYYDNNVVMIITKINSREYDCVQTRESIDIINSSCSKGNNTIEFVKNELQILNGKFEVVKDSLLEKLGKFFTENPSAYMTRIVTDKQTQ